MKDNDKVIHEAMVLCDHEWEGEEFFFAKELHSVCQKCWNMKAAVTGKIHYPSLPDYAKDLRPVFEWMRGTGKYGLSRWRDFTNFLNKKEIDYLFEFHDKDCSEQRDLIAQWITASDI